MSQRDRKQMVSFFEEDWRSTEAGKRSAKKEERAEKKREERSEKKNGRESERALAAAT